MGVTKAAFLVLGPAGVGHTTALDVFSDFGFMSLAGVRPEQLGSLLEGLRDKHDTLAFSVMVPPEWVENPSALSDFAAQVADLKARFAELKVLYLEAPEPVIVQRYQTSGKRHAFEAVAPGVEQAVAAERRLLGDTLKKLKDYSIDTSTHTPAELRNKIAKVLGHEAGAQEMTIYITSFGFKYGIPLDAELLFDMRFITNPFYVENLRPLTGLDRPVKDYILAQEAVVRFRDQWTAMMATMLPQFQREGKTRVSLAIGCTGGKHRSVCMTEELADFIRIRFPDYRVMVVHRENFRWPSQRLATDLPADASPEAKADAKIISATVVGGGEGR